MGLRMTLFGFFFASAFGQLFDCLVGSCCGQTACSAEYKGDDRVTRTDNLRGNKKRQQGRTVRRERRLSAV